MWLKLGKTFRILCCVDVRQKFTIKFAIVTRRLTEHQRWQAICMLQTGSTLAQAAADLNVSQYVFVDCGHDQTTVELIDFLRSGRPRFTDVRYDRYVFNHARRNRAQTTTDLQQCLRHVRVVNVSRQTIRNRLHSDRLNAKRPHVVLPLSS